MHSYKDSDRKLHYATRVDFSGIKPIICLFYLQQNGHSMFRSKFRHWHQQDAGRTKKFSKPFLMQNWKKNSI